MYPLISTQLQTSARRSRSLALLDSAPPAKEAHGILRVWCSVGLQRLHSGWVWDRGLNDVHYYS